MRNTARVEAALVLLVMLALWGLPIAAVVVPPIVMADQRRRSPVAAGLWLAAVALVVGWVVAVVVEMDRVDATGGTGSILAEGEWLVAAVVVATASVLVSRRRAGVPSGTVTR